MASSALSATRRLMEVLVSCLPLEGWAWLLDPRVTAPPTAACLTPMACLLPAPVAKVPPNAVRTFLGVTGIAGMEAVIFRPRGPLDDAASLLYLRLCGHLGHYLDLDCAFSQHFRVGLGLPPISA